MGWCSVTYIFDSVVSELVKKKDIDKVEIIKILSVAMEEMDWDCQSDSKFYEHPLVKKARPDWFEDEE